jgi:hypothetical protein
MGIKTGGKDYYVELVQFAILSLDALWREFRNTILSGANQFDIVLIEALKIACFEADPLRTKGMNLFLRSQQFLVLLVLNAWKNLASPKLVPGSIEYY